MMLREQNVQNQSEKSILGTIALGALEGPLGGCPFLGVRPLGAQVGLRDGAPNRLK